MKTAILLFIILSMFLLIISSGVKSKGPMRKTYSNYIFSVSNVEASSNAVIIHDGVDVYRIYPNRADDSIILPNNEKLYNKELKEMEDSDIKQLENDWLLRKRKNNYFFIEDYQME